MRSATYGKLKQPLRRTIFRRTLKISSFMASGDFPPSVTPLTTFEKFMSPKSGGPAELYEGLTQSTLKGSLYITQCGGLPPYSTTFWRADQPLVT